MSPAGSDATVQLMNRARMQRMIKRMAYQILEDQKDKYDLYLYGIDMRGFDTAKLLASELKKISSRKIHAIKLATRTDEPLSVTPKPAKAYVLVVDDVLFSGKTMMKALTKVMESISFQILRVAVMVDRGHRVLPVHADFTGLVSPTKLNERVEVIFGKGGTAEQVILYRSLSS